MPSFKRNLDLICEHLLKYNTTFGFRFITKSVVSEKTLEIKEILARISAKTYTKNVHRLTDRRRNRYHKVVSTT